METNSYNWDATTFFENLTTQNLLARANEFRFCRVSGMDGFQEALSSMQNTKAFVCVNEVSQGYTSLDNSPRTRRVKTVFLAMRHNIDDMKARQNRFDTLREIFRQFMTVLIKEKTKLEEHCIELDRRITFHEIDEYFFSGCACAYFSVAVDVHTDLRYDENEWVKRFDPR
ncbi:MAG: hypothetical protein E7080_09755 [Bacteroidales bacterium]|nr:hypothetical protein [Bacteroidales bacterium]